MRYLKIVLRIVVIAGVLAFLDYALPSRDLVKIVGTEVVRTEVGANSLFWAQPIAGDANPAIAGNRDIRFINSVRGNGSARVYRNEDTGWGWPPYLKFDSGNLQAEAQQLQVSGSWVAVTHYGWRSTLLSIYPNAISISEVSGPEVTLVPWARIIAAVLLILFGVILWRIWVRFSRWAFDRLDRIRSKF